MDVGGIARVSEHGQHPAILSERDRRQPFDLLALRVLGEHAQQHPTDPEGLHLILNHKRRFRRKLAFAFVPAHPADRVLAWESGHKSSAVAEIHFGEVFSHRLRKVGHRCKKAQSSGLSGEPLMKRLQPPRIIWFDGPEAHRPAVPKLGAARLVPFTCSRGVHIGPVRQTHLFRV